MQLHAAILQGPSGPFAVLRTKADEGETPVSDDARRAIARCFKERHENIPVAFLAHEPTGMKLIGFEDATPDLEQCVREQVTPQTQWAEFHPA